MKSVHGHYSDIFENEIKRIIKLYREQLNVEITHVEATAIAAERSYNTFLTDKQLRTILARLRGL